VCSSIVSIKTCEGESLSGVHRVILGLFGRSAWWERETSIGVHVKNVKKLDVGLHVR